MTDTLEYVETLTATNRCDRCNAQAYVRTILGFSVLDFCKHDYEAHSDRLAAQGFTVAHDNRHVLTNR